MVKHILVATDLSPGSDEALRQAAVVAAGTAAHVTVCHVFPSPISASPYFQRKTGPAVGEASALRARAFELLAQQIAATTPKLNAEIIAEEGTPYAGIVRCAEALHADWIVVGSTGTTALPGLHLGSVAEQVARHAHCSVLVARPSAPSGVVLAATDLSDPSLPAVAAAAAEAVRRNARLHVTHAVDFDSLRVSFEEMLIGALEPHSNWNLDTEVRERVTQELRAGLDRCGATGIAEVTRGPAATAVVRYAEEHRAELLVVGARGRTGLLRVALGSVAKRILATASCSVLVVRPPVAR